MFVVARADDRSSLVVLAFVPGEVFLDGFPDDPGDIAVLARSWLSAYLASRSLSSAVTRTGGSVVSRIWLTVLCCWLICRQLGRERGLAVRRLLCC